MLKNATNRKSDVVKKISWKIILTATHRTKIKDIINIELLGLTRTWPDKCQDCRTRREQKNCIKANEESGNKVHKIVDNLINNGSKSEKNREMCN